MAHKILFNKENSAFAYGDHEWDSIFIRQNEVHMNDLLMTRGYVYMNSIYEALGFKWDPKWENPCCIFYQGVRIHLRRHYTDKGFEVTIEW